MNPHRGSRFPEFSAFESLVPRGKIKGQQNELDERLGREGTDSQEMERELMESSGSRV